MNHEVTNKRRFKDEVQPIKTKKQRSREGVSKKLTVSRGGFGLDIIIE